MKTHYLKTIQPYFDQVKNGNKRFEFRKNDRDFYVGDLLILEKYNPVSKSYLGKSIVVIVTHILKDFDGLSPDYCVLSIKLLEL